MPKRKPLTVTSFIEIDGVTREFSSLSEEEKQNVFRKMEKNFEAGMREYYQSAEYQKCQA